ncbi:MAG: FecR domain-containing protein [Planctomycetota bacterium]|nr:FecR domain-containing protein [Planctomycetota bacterium]
MNNQRLLELIDGKLDERLDESDQIELARMLRESAEAREIYWEFVEQDALLHDLVQESAGRDLAQMGLGDRAVDQVLIGTGSQKLARQATGTRRWMVRGALLVTLGLLVVAGLQFQLSRPGVEIAPAESAAVLQSLTGDVWLIKPDGDSVKATSGQQFAAGDAVRVGEDGAAEIVLTDGSRVALSAESLLRFASDGSQAGSLRHGARNGLHLDNGGAEIEAAPQLPDRPLIITTGQARLTVLGTRFRLYAASEDSRVELEEGKVRFERQSDGQSVEVAAGQYAVATTDVESPQPLVAGPLHAEWRLRQTLLRAGSRVVFSHDGTQLATAGFPRLKVWNVATAELHHELQVGVRFECLSFTPSDELLVGLDDHGTAMVWPIGKPDAQRSELKAQHGKLRRCAVSRDGRWLAQTTSADSGHLQVWQVDDGGVISPLNPLGMKAGGVAITATATGPQVVSSVWHGTTVKWDAETGRELTRYELASELNVVRLSADGRRFGGYGNKTGLLLIDTETGEQRTLWPPGSVRANDVCFSRDGRMFFAGMADGVVRAWSTTGGRSLLVLPTGDSQIRSLDISDNGRWLAVSGNGERVTIWRSESM